MAHQEHSPSYRYLKMTRTIISTMLEHTNHNPNPILIPIINPCAKTTAMAKSHFGHRIRSEGIVGATKQLLDSSDSHERKLQKHLLEEESAMMHKERIEKHRQGFECCQTILDARNERR